MVELTIYEKPTCTTCRNLSKLLAERNVDFEKVDYYVEPLSEAQLRDLFAKAGIGPRDALRTREDAYSDLGIAGGSHTDDELIALMAEHPDLLQRPIVVRGERAVLARPPERVLELLD